MDIQSLDINGLKVLTPRIFGDSRGYFFESYSKKIFDREVCTVNFVQDNQSKSCYGVIRGLHFQKPPHAQAKLVRCIAGTVVDIAVDIRLNSPTYGQHAAILLSEDNHHQFFIPKGFAHGFMVLSDFAVFQYKCDDFYAPEYEGGINFTDSSLCIDIPIPEEKRIMSDKDLKYPSIAEFETPFIYNENC